MSVVCKFSHLIFGAYMYVIVSLKLVFLFFYTPVILFFSLSLFVCVCVKILFARRSSVDEKVRRLTFLFSYLYLYQNRSGL